MKRIFIYILLCATLEANAQHVKLYVAGTPHCMKAEETQTEVKPGWKIIDIQLKDKATKYLCGKHAQQLTESRTPTFFIEPDEKELLVDYAFIKLKEKKQHRALKSHKLHENGYTRITPQDFSIKAVGSMAFECTPKLPLEKGEYILLNIVQKPIGELHDFKTYPFRVP